MPPAEVFRHALAALQVGNTTDAERLFRAVLRSEPRHVGALNLLGVVLTRSGRFAEAEAILRRALKENSQSDATHYNYGLVLKSLNRAREAWDSFTNALALNPSLAESWNNRGTVANDLKRFADAIADFDKAITLHPGYAEAFCNKGKSLCLLQRWDEAASAYERALALKPELAEGWIGLGNVAFERRRYQDALAAYDKALALRVDLAEAWLGRGNALTELRRYDDAFAAHEKALTLRPDWPEAWLGRGNLFTELRRYDEALAAYDKALALEPELLEAWVGRGNSLVQKKQYAEGLATYDHALSLKKTFAPAWLGRGNALLARDQYDDALASYDRAIDSKPDFAEAWCSRGNACIIVERLDEAWIAYDRALILDPNLAEAWLGRGNLLVKSNRYDDALPAYDEALAAKPDLAEAWLARGFVLNYHHRYADAFAAYDRAVAIKPQLTHAAGERLTAKLYLCDWTDLESEITRLLTSLRSGEEPCVPIVMLTIPSTMADQLQCARSYVRPPPAVLRSAPAKNYDHDRLRIAYVSSDLRDHPVGQLIVGLIDNHDRSRFHVTAISLAVGQDTDFQRRLQGAFDRFFDCSSLDVRKIAELMRRHEVDIAVDLNGYTRHARPNIFAQRPASIQVGYLGFAGTTGADYMDYIIADPIVAPQDHFGFYSEKVVWLPDTFLANDAKRLIAERTPSRRELHLPDEAFVFCCFNQPLKISPTIFEIWMRLLTAIDGSVLWLKDNGAAADNLRREAERRGVAPQRLVFAPSVPDAADHLARHRQADLFLDTLPYNAHTTASDALWAGLPVLTCLGATFASRVAASLLHAVGLDELVTTSLEGYEALALKLARDRALLGALKSKLARNRDTYPLFGTKRFTRHIEAAYCTMAQLRARGEPPQSFAVQPCNLPSS